MKKACRRNITLHGSTRCFDLNLPDKSVQKSEFVTEDHKKIIHSGGNDAKFTTRSAKSSTLEMKILTAFIQRGIWVKHFPQRHTQEGEERGDHRGKGQSSACRLSGQAGS